MVNDFFDIFSGWFCEAFDLTLDELLGHVALRFLSNGDEIKSIRLNILIDHPVQRNAENLLIDFIDRHAMTVQRKNVVCRVHPSRTTDWVRTHVEQNLMKRKGEYWSTARLAAPDLNLRMGLANLLDRWDNLLGLQPTDDRIERRKRLQSVRSKLPSQHHPWSFPMTKQLSMLDKTVGNAVSACLHHWERPAVRGKELKDLVRQWNLPARNKDNLFEWIIAMKIARDAMNNGWSVQKIRDRIDKAKYGDFLLKKGCLWLRISKGKPRDGNNELLTIDKVALIAKRHGLGASGFEPDVVLTFFNEENPRNVITFLADAKNNQTGDGKDYIRSQIGKAATYVYAYEKILQHTPKCTLFFWRDALDGDDLTHVLDEIKERKNENAIDDVLCINHNIFQPDLTTDWFKLIESKINLP